jgi:hypothetical protein
MPDAAEPLRELISLLSPVSYVPNFSQCGTRPNFCVRAEA